MALQSQLTDRTMDILEAVAALGDSPLSAIAERCDLPFSTVHRVIQTLVERGYVVSERRGSYRLGAAAIALGRGVHFRDLLRDLARPSVAGLARRCRASANLGVLEHDMVTYLVKHPFGRARLPPAEGEQLEAYCSAVGRVLLAALDDGEVRHYMAEGEMVRLTQNTIIDEAALLAELVEVRQRGWAIEMGEIIPGLSCIAVPVRDGDGAICAGLSLSLQDADMSRARLVALVPLLQAASAEITGKIFPRAADHVAMGRSAQPRRNPA